MTSIIRSRRCLLFILLAISVGLMLAAPPARAEGTLLSTGDIAIVGINSDGDDDFSFLMLKDIAAGTSLYFTDKGWNDGTGFYTVSGDGTWQWTTSSALPKGTVVHIKTSNNGIIEAGSLAASPGTAVIIESNGNTISYSGDQIFLYQGTAASPTIITGIHWNVEATSTDANWDGAATATQTSALPDQLTNGMNAIWVHGPSLLECDNFRYKETALNTGTPAQLRAAINDLANWDVDTASTTAYTLNPFPVTFTVISANTAPILAANTGMTVNEGSTGNTVTQAMLEVTDAEQSAGELTYTLTAAPGNGTLYKDSTALDTSSNKTFTQSDINGSKITYTHNGSETTSDSFKFTVSDGDGGSIPETTFSITVTPVNDAPQASNVQVTGTAVFGQELSGSYTYSDAEGDTQGTSTYKWYRADNASGLNQAEISGAVLADYTLQEADIGKYICFEVTPVAQTGASPGTAVKSAWTGAVQKADCETATGITPVLSSKTDTSVTLTAVTGYEYIRVANGAAVGTGIWQDSNVFTGLSSSTAYDFYQRVKETATHNASGISDKLDVTTDAAVLTGTAGITGSAVYGQTLTASLSGGNNTGTLSYQWVRGSADIPLAVSSTYVLVEADIGAQISVKITSSVETGTVTSSPTAAVLKADCETATGITPVLSSKTDTTVTLTAVTGYEYIYVANDAAVGTGTWQDSNVFTGLSASTAYDFYQRVKETATHNASGISEKLDVTTDTPALTGTAGITGSAVFGQTLTASLSGSNNTGTLSYQWVRGSTDIPLAVSSTYVLVEADIGAQISVKITSSVESGTVTSAPTAAVQKADCLVSTGVTPVLSSKTASSVTLTGVTGYEYIRVANGAAVGTGTWQDSNVFTGLSSSTAYDFYQRVKETATYKASGISEKLDVTTDAAALTGTAGITGSAVYSQTLTASLSGSNNTGTLSYQWVRGSADIPLAVSSTYMLVEADIGAQISVKITSSVESGTVASAPTAAVLKADCLTATGITPVLSAKTDISVTLSSVTGYEYIRVANGVAVGTGTWQDSNVFTGLLSSTAYDFYQRVKETATHNASGISEKLDVTTDAPALTGTAGITGSAVFGQILTASLSGSNNTGTLSYQWIRGSTDIPLAASSTYVLVEADVGAQISVRITSSVESGTVTSAPTAAVQKADCLTATGITPVLSAKTDISVTLASVPGYEYVCVANGAAVGTGTWQDSNVFTGLTGSTAYDFYQRVKETTAYKASGVSEKLDVTTDAPLVYSASIAPLSKVFPAATEEYGVQAAQQFTISNTGTGSITGLSAALGGTDFEVSAALSSTAIGPSGTATVSVRPKTGLMANTYTDTLTVTGSGGILLTASLSFTVDPAPTYTASIDPASKVFPGATEEYGVQAAQQFTISNTGTGSITGLSAALGGTDFEVSAALSSTAIGPSGTATVSVRPKTGLTADTYTDTLTVTGVNGILLTASLSFTVAPVPTYMAAADPAAVDFGSLAEGYIQPDAKTVTVTNTGNQPISLYQPTAVRYDIGTLSAASLAPGAAATFTIVPKEGLTVGTWNETVQILGANGVSTQVEASFTCTPPVEYDILGGNGSSYQPGTQNPSPITFTASGSLQGFTGLTLNGAPVDEGDYDVREGSTIVTLHQDYLDSLLPGDYTLRFHYTDGFAEASFVVYDRMPVTGDNDALALYGALAVLSLAALMLLGRKRARR